MKNRMALAAALRVLGRGEVASRVVPTAASAPALGLACLLPRATAFPSVRNPFPTLASCFAFPHFGQGVQTRHYSRKKRHGASNPKTRQLMPSRANKGHHPNTRIISVLRRRLTRGKTHGAAMAGYRPDGKTMQNLKKKGY